MWQEIVDKKDEWIGGSYFERDPMFKEVQGTIADIKLVHFPAREIDGHHYDGYTMFVVVGSEGQAGFRVNVNYFGVGGPALHGGLPILGSFAGASSYEICRKGESVS